MIEITFYNGNGIFKICTHIFLDQTFIFINNS
jgi:hypothetical protein